MFFSARLEKDRPASCEHADLAAYLQPRVIRGCILCDTVRIRHVLAFGIPDYCRHVTPYKVKWIARYFAVFPWKCTKQNYYTQVSVVCNPKTWWFLEQGAENLHSEE